MKHEVLMSDADHPRVGRGESGVEGAQNLKEINDHLRPVKADGPVQLSDAAGKQGQPSQIFKGRSEDADASPVRVCFEIGTVKGDDGDTNAVQEKLGDNAGLAFPHGDGTELVAVSLKNLFQGQGLGHVTPAFSLHNKKKSHRHPL